MLAVSLMLGGMACGDSPSARPTTLARHPHALDRLARLMRAEFASADPLMVEQAIRCESARLERVLGPDLFVRQRLLVDSLHDEFAAEQFNLLGRRLGSAPTPFGDAPACRALNADAEREALLAGRATVPVDADAPSAVDPSLRDTSR